MPDQEQQFKELFDRFKKPVYTYIENITGSAEDASDITQEVFIRLWKKRNHFGQIINMDAYVFRIAHNLTMSYFKKVSSDSRLFLELRSRMTENANSTIDQIDYKETSALLDKAIESLTPQRKRVYILSRREGLSLEEISEELQLSRNTVRNHLVTALRDIRDYYKNETYPIHLSLIACILLISIFL